MTHYEGVAAQAYIAARNLDARTNHRPPCTNGDLCGESAHCPPDTHTPLERHADEQAAGNDRGAAPYVAERPARCCGVCPEIEGGGYDCTCAGNPRCPKSPPAIRHEAAWRKAIADQVRANCTPSSEAYRAGGDALVYAVAGWIENPPEWSTFTAPSAEAEADRLALDAARGEVERLRAGITALADDLALREFEGTLDLDGLRISDALRALLTSRPTDTEDPR